jgi:hypothetical protein
MNTSIFLARLIGPVFLAGGAGVLLNAAAYRALALEFIGSHALIYLSGLLTMSAGMAVILTHNVWAADWRVLITVIGWLATIGGALRIVSPRAVEQIGRAMLGNRTALTIGGAVWLALGALLCFFGYFR